MWQTIDNLNIISSDCDFQLLDDTPFRHQVEWAVNGMITEYEKSGASYPEAGLTLFVNEKADTVELWKDKGSANHLKSKLSDWE